ncbi:MAG: GGDEF domain-containing protein [Lachnospiraceae bacterium]|nr:GGDEF domain-containing protein [Lachnospiraceae bacterium]
MDYNDLTACMNKITSVLSVQINPDGSPGEICLEAANDIYLKSVHVERKDFVPGLSYDHYVPKDRNYEAMSYRCVKENRMIHSYIDAGLYNAWMEVYMLPLRSDDPDKPCYLFSYDMTDKADVEKLTDVSPEIAMHLMGISLKLRETDDFQQAMDYIIEDIRISCEANRSCILLTDYKNRTCSPLCASASDIEDLPPISEEIFDGFFDVVETWDALIAGSNCYIIHNEKELELVREKSPIWYETLKASGITNVVLYPLKINGETIGYIWATNFNSDRTLKIKEILEVATFLLAAEISNHQLLKEMKMLSNMDLLTGLLNRNAMNNRISRIESGQDELTGDYGIVFADLNGLKKINDSKGHIEGDRALKAAALELKKGFDGSSCDIFRIGGDEFMVIVTGRSEEEFDRMVSNLRKSCGDDDSVKMAIGSCYCRTDTEIKKALYIADENMYRDKEEYYLRHPELKGHDRES